MSLYSTLYMILPVWCLAQGSHIPAEFTDQIFVKDANAPIWRFPQSPLYRQLFHIETFDIVLPLKLSLNHKINILIKQK